MRPPASSTAYSSRGRLPEPGLSEEEEGPALALQGVVQEHSDCGFRVLSLRESYPHERSSSGSGRDGRSSLVREPRTFQPLAPGGANGPGPVPVGQARCQNTLRVSFSARSWRASPRMTSRSP